MFCKHTPYLLALSRELQYKPIVAAGIMSCIDSIEDISSLSQNIIDTFFGEDQSKYEKIISAQSYEWGSAECDWAIKNNITILSSKDCLYPRLLKEISDPPPVIYVKGILDSEPNESLSIVGTRKASRYGTGIVREIIEELSNIGYNPTIFSGLAYGIDYCAHRYALDYKLKTVAILPCGPEKIYPAAHTKIAKEIIENGGAIITDFHRFSEPFKVNFLQRNRIIAGISQATLLAESGYKGGGVITARMASAYDREVFAIPGRASDFYSAGCNSLIEESTARIYISAGKMGSIMGWIPTENSKQTQLHIFKDQDPEKEKILVALNPNLVLEFNTLLHITSLSASTLAQKLIELELDGVITSMHGAKYRITKGKK